MIVSPKWFVLLPSVTFATIAAMASCPVQNPCDKLECKEGEYCEVQQKWPLEARCVLVVPSPSPPSPSPSPSPLPTPSPSPSPLPSPSPTATPSSPPSPVPSLSPSPLPSSTPSPSGCPEECREDNDDTLWMGVALRSVVAANPHGCKFLNRRYNYDATPHTLKLLCQDRPGKATEQRKDCQNPHGPDFYMTLAGHYTNDPCDKFSQQAFWCHDHPEGRCGVSGKGAQVGKHVVCAVPEGDDPESGRGRCVTVNVQP